MSAPALPGPLSAATVAQWKLHVKNEALSQHAHMILSGRETEPDQEEERKDWRDYHKRRSGIAAFMRKSLDYAQTETLLRHVDEDDAEGIFDTLVAHYEPKTAQSRASSILNLLTVRMNEEETYSDFGARVISLASQVRDRLDSQPSYRREEVQEQEVLMTVPASEGTSPSTVKATKKILVTPSKFDAGYSVLDLIKDLTMAIVILGLPHDGKLRETLTHQDDIDDVEGILEHLRRADQLIKSDAMLEEAANSAKSKPKTSKPKTGKYKCKIHGPNNSHDDSRCYKQQEEKEEKDKAKGKKKAKKANIAKAKEESDESESDEEKVMMASVKHIASTPCYRQKHLDADQTWNADSGATSHMTPHRQWIRDMEPCQVPVKLANNSRVWATGRGKVVFQPSGNRESVVFENVLYVPKLQNNLFSILSVVKKSKVRVVIENDLLEFSKGGKDLFTASIRGTTGTLDGTTLNNDEHAYVAAVSKDIWHERLGHIGKDRLNRLISKKLAKGIFVKPGTEMKEFCDACMSGKQHREPFPKASDNRSPEILGCAHSDLHGPLPQTIDGFKYWITFTDDCSRNKGVYNLKKKSEAFAKFKEWVAEVE